MSSSVSARCEPRKPAAPVMTTRPLVGMFVEEAFDDREPDDFQVETDGPILDVVEVVLNPLVERRVAAPAVHLRPAGHAGFHLVAQHVLRNAVLELLDEMRPLRPRTDNRHVSAKD